jgi:hypothetical protein
MVRAPEQQLRYTAVAMAAFVRLKLSPYVEQEREQFSETEPKRRHVGDRWAFCDRRAFCDECMSLYVEDEQLRKDGNNVSAQARAIIATRESGG